MDINIALSVVCSKNRNVNNARWSGKGGGVREGGGQRGRNTEEKVRMM